MLDGYISLIFWWKWGCNWRNFYVFGSKQELLYIISKFTNQIVLKKTRKKGAVFELLKVEGYAGLRGEAMLFAGLDSYFWDSKEIITKITALGTYGKMHNFIYENLSKSQVLLIIGEEMFSLMFWNLWWFGMKVL